MKRAKPDLDALCEWLETRCEIDPAFCDYTRTLWPDWKYFAWEREVEPGSPRSFANELRKRGFPRQRLEAERKVRVHLGLRRKRFKLPYPRMEAKLTRLLNPPWPPRLPFEQAGAIA